jgi:hypothetical protein
MLLLLLLLMMKKMGWSRALAAAFQFGLDRKAGACEERGVSVGIRSTLTTSQGAESGYVYVYKIFVQGKRVPRGCTAASCRERIVHLMYDTI